ncbi:MAG: acyl carrier protein [Sulfuritalea sp.]|nr:acyl carrier protein [Sulfuritalea sp.]
MNPAEIRATAIAILLSIAPEVEATALRDDRPLRRQVDLDSMDWLNFLLGLNGRFGVEIPEADYVKLVTLGDVVDYLARRMR